MLAQAADLGVLQLHLSGGEPTVRRDLEEIVAQAAKVGLYSNLITSAVTLTRERLEALAAHGLDHVQISIQDTDAANADRIAHYQGGHAKKLEVAGWVRALGLPLTLNAPIHRQNIASLPAFIDLAESLGAQRLEVAHVQYYGWALKNRQALMPTRDQVLEKRRASSPRPASASRASSSSTSSCRTTTPSAPSPAWAAGAAASSTSRRRARYCPATPRSCCPVLTFDNVRDKKLRDIWLEFERLSDVSRDAMDAGALPHLRIPRAGLGRLPLPGLRLYRRCDARRSSLPQIRASR